MVKQRRSIWGQGVTVHISQEPEESAESEESEESELVITEAVFSMCWMIVQQIIQSHSHHSLLGKWKTANLELKSCHVLFWVHWMSHLLTTDPTVNI